MGYAVELYFEGETADRLVALTHKVYTACGGADLAGLGFRPHISLASYATLAVDALLPVLAAFADQTMFFSLKLDAVGVFPTPMGVVYLAPVVTQHLLAIHKAFHQQAEAAGQESDSYYRVGNWVPHCTIAHDLPPDRLATAVQLCVQSDVFARAFVFELGLIEYRPVRTLARYALSGGFAPQAAD
jgi:2'-5' RNA ligase